MESIHFLRKVTCVIELQAEPHFYLNLIFYLKEWPKHTCGYSDSCLAHIVSKISKVNPLAFLRKGTGIAVNSKV